MLTDEHIVLNAYVSSDRNQIVLHSDSWEAVREHNVILFRELENGSKQISCGEYFDRRATVEDIKHSIRLLLERVYWHDKKKSDFYENIMSADFCLESDYQKEVQG
ncbi:MAG: hypothetical protein J6W10_03165 [Kiritimatiellae bacterium]|nr:hypothetical protein [Kiritimatiellia bacterium]